MPLDTDIDEINKGFSTQISTNFAGKLHVKHAKGHVILIFFFLNLMIILYLI